MLTENEKAFVNRLESKGIQLILNCPPPSGGFSFIDVGQLEDYLSYNDTDEYWAENYGVSPYIFKEYQKQFYDPTCQALTKKGKPCKNGIHDFPKWDGEDSILNYNPDIDNYCRMHRRLS